MLLENLQSELRKHRGSIQEIADQCGVHRNWVHRVLKGSDKNQRVLDQAIKTLSERKLRLQQETEEINKRIEFALK